LLNNAFEEQLAFQRALKEYVDSVDPIYAKDNEELFVAFEGSFGNKHLTPRALMSRFLGNLVCVEGIVTKCEFSFYIYSIPLLFAIHINTFSKLV
jgi:DNA replication licensing factor MCM3